MCCASHRSSKAAINQHDTLPIFGILPNREPQHIVTTSVPHRSRAPAWPPLMLLFLVPNELPFPYLPRPLQTPPFFPRCPTSWGHPKRNNLTFSLAFHCLLTPPSPLSCLIVTYLAFDFSLIYFGNSHLLYLLLIPKILYLGLINMWVHPFGLTNMLKTCWLQVAPSNGQIEHGWGG